MKQAAHPGAGVHARVTLERGPIGRVGASRIALLEAVRETGSLTAAAQRHGLSYKAAWDAVQVLNNLFDRPLVSASAGGRQGGATAITAAGEAVIAAFHAAQAELAGTIARLEQSLAASAGGSIKPLLWGFAMKTSVRNALRGTVTRVTADAVSAEVILKIAEGVELVATITRHSAEDLGLVEGATAIALIKSSFVILARGDNALRTSARNSLAGIVTAREDSEIGSEITLELQVGKTLTATITRESADALDLVVGANALALVKSSHVILAVE